MRWIGPRRAAFQVCKVHGSIRECRPHPLKPTDIAGGNARASGQGGGGDQGIKARNRTTGPATGHDEFSIMPGGGFVEPQDPPRQVLGENRASGRRQRRSATSFRQSGDAAQNFGLADTRGIQAGTGLGANPGQHQLDRFRAH